MSAPRLPLMLVAFLLLAGLGLAWLLALNKQVQSDKPVSGNASAVASEQDGTPGTGHRPVPRATVDAATARAGISPWDLTFNAGGDLHALARSCLVPAQNGEPECTWALYRALRFCEHHLSVYPTRARLESLRAHINSKGLGRSRVDSLAEREFLMCDGFRNDPVVNFGASEAWFEQAVALGHPLAGLEAASALAHAWNDLQSEDLDDRRRAADGAPPGSIDHLHSDYAIREISGRGLDGEAIQDAAQSAARAAISTGRPDAYFFLAFESWGIRLTPEDGDGLLAERNAWGILACRSGYPCGPDSQWVLAFEMYNSNTQSRDGATMLLDNVPVHLRETVLERVAELEALRAAGDYAAMLGEDGW